jgi:pimeloyl-ACP methyl ester carboxylesterase
MNNPTLKLNDHVFEYSLKGEGNKSIVLVNGFRMPLDSWNLLHPGIEKLGKVFAYNRPGIGYSSKARSNQTGTTVVETLRTLLKIADLSPPYVLVGHSLGGLFTNLYARMYPEEVSGMVLVDATHPDEPKKQNELQPHNFVVAINDWLKSIERTFDHYKYSEEETIDETINQVNQAGSFPQIPLAVVSGTKKMPFVPEKNFEIHLRFQKELTTLSSTSKHYAAEGSGHFPQITEPEIVLAAIKDVVELAKTA